MSDPTNPTQPVDEQETPVETPVEEQRGGEAADAVDPNVLDELFAETPAATDNPADEPAPGARVTLAKNRTWGDPEVDGQDE